MTEENNIAEETSVDDILTEFGIENTEDKSVDEIIAEIEKGESKENDVTKENDDTKENDVQPDTKPVENTKDKTYDDYTKEELIAHLQKKDKRIADKDTFIGKRSSEIGDLRKQLAELEKSKNEIVDPSDDDAIENPIESMKKIQENVNKRQELESRISNIRSQDISQNNIRIIEETLGKDYDYKTNMTAVIEILKQDEAGDKFINAFINNPGSFDTSVTFNLFKRAEASLKIASLEKKIEDLTKSKKSITDNFNKAGKKSINDIPATVGKDYSNIDIDSLTPAQVDKLLKTLK